MSKSRKKFYAPITSRRDFLKLVGVGAATLGAPKFAKSFKDEAEMLSSPLAERKLPFWIREVDEPTIEIDWDVIQRADMRKNLFVSAPKYLDMNEFKNQMMAGAQRRMEGAINNTPGLTVRDQALGAVSWGFMNMFVPWTGIPLQKTPEENGYPRWEGTPEENARMVRVAARYFGASDAGFLKVDERVKKLIFTHGQVSADGDITAGGRPIVFEDVPEAYETPEKLVIPNIDLWAMVFEIPQSLVTTQRGEFGNFGSSDGFGYARNHFFDYRMHDFIHALGYQHIGGNGIEVGPTAAFGTLAGLGEMGRTMRLVSPKHGNCLRSTIVLLTDLPLAVTKPIDAGIWNFCQTCKKCAENCPTGCLSMDDEPSWEVKGEWNNPGLKGFYSDDPMCYPQMIAFDCVLCHAVCPYNKMDKASLHEIVKMTISKAPMFNGLIRTLDDTFDYGHVENPEDFWEMEDLPLYGLDPSRSS